MVDLIRWDELAIWKFQSLSSLCLTQVCGRVCVCVCVHLQEDEDTWQIEVTRFRAEVDEKRTDEEQIQVYRENEVSLQILFIYFHIKYSM